MARVALLLLLSLFLVLHVARSEEEDVKQSLINFLSKLTHNNSNADPLLGWSMNTDPCIDQWKGVVCDTKLISVKKIALDGFSLTGPFDIASLCKAENLNVLSFQGNNFTGALVEEIGDCKQLTHLLLSANQFSGILPESISGLNNLKKLEVANNRFSGELPNLARISGLVSFLAENNKFTGEIPKFQFDNFQSFNVSNNDFSGPVPDLDDRFSLDSISGNPGLCGPPLSNACTPSPPSPTKKPKSKNHSVEHALMYSGYMLIGVVVLGFIAFKLFTKKKTKCSEIQGDSVKPKGASSADTSNNKASGISNEYKASISKAEHSIPSADQSAVMSSSMVVLSSPVVKGLRFEDLLKAPAELLGRGNHGSLYKVVLEDGMPLVVKRIKDWAISGEDFKKRMQKIDEAKHPNVLSAVAFYSSKQEKLVVYKYQQNGSLFKILTEAQNGEIFDWDSRLHVAVKMAEAMAFMHKELLDEGIAHGNLKSSNIVLNLNMDPCISEYGLMVPETQESQSLPKSNAYKTKDIGINTFKADLYGFGVILLELLTGKLVDNNALDLAKWVHSVVSEEWTAEVFDKNLMKDGASEERMLNLLQVALKCTNPLLDARPSMSEVSTMINSIMEAEEASMVSEFNSMN